MTLRIVPRCALHNVVFRFVVIHEFVFERTVVAVLSLYFAVRFDASELGNRTHAQFTNGRPIEQMLS